MCPAPAGATGGLTLDCPDQRGGRGGRVSSSPRILALPVCVLSQGSGEYVGVWRSQASPVQVELQPWGVTSRVPRALCVPEGGEGRAGRTARLCVISGGGFPVAGGVPITPQRPGPRLPGVVQDVGWTEAWGWSCPPTCGVWVSPHCSSHTF